MPTYTTQTITGKPDGYQYSDPRKTEARSPISAAQRHCEDIERPRPSEVCVLVHKSDEPSFCGEVFLGTLAEDGEYAFRPAVTKKALMLANVAVKLCKEIEDLSKGDADSLRRLLESIEIDCSTRSIDEHHPASSDFNVSLNTTDAFAGLRLLIHLAHDLPNLDHSEIETGGFSPVGGDENVNGRELYRAGRTLRDCKTEEQRDQWEVEAQANWVIGRQLHEKNQPRSKCENLDQEYGWDQAAR